MIEKVILNALRSSYKIHEQLGARGEELVQKNRFGETALRVDIECEKAVLESLVKDKVPIKVISEEHGVTQLHKKPVYLGILDGLDGSKPYKQGRGKNRYGTMFGIYFNLNPSYDDYLAAGIMEHSTNRLLFALKGKGCFLYEKGKKKRIHVSSKTGLNHKTKIYIDAEPSIDYYTPIILGKYGRIMKHFDYQFFGSTAVNFFDMAIGTTDLDLECTRKGNLEFAVGYPLIKEAGGFMVTLDGKSIGPKKFLEFGQNEHVPIITASTIQLVRDAINYIHNKN